jgi:hypothetical protein
LSISYRLSPPMTIVVSDVLLKTPGFMLSNPASLAKSFPSVEWVRGDFHNVAREMVRVIKRFLSEPGIVENDIFILAPSVKGVSTDKGIFLQTF